MSGSNNLEYYITLGWKGWHETKTLTYSAYLSRYEENEVLQKQTPRT